MAATEQDIAARRAWIEGTSWQTGRLLWAPHKTATDTTGIGLSGEVGETRESTTPKFKEDVRILAATTNLDTSQVTLSDHNSERVLNNAPIPIRHIAGRHDSPRPWQPWKPPLTINEDGYMRAAVLNPDGEGSATDPGHLVYLCDPVKAARRSIEYHAEKIFPFWLDIPLNLTAVINESKSIETPTDYNRGTILFGAGSDLSNIFIYVQDAEGEEWTTDDVPIWSFAALTAGDIVTNIWPRAYYIPPGKAVTLRIRNAASAPSSDGHIYFSAAKVRL